MQACEGSTIVQKTSDSHGPGADALRVALSTVIDPEIGLDIITLGLVFEAGVVGDCATIVYTLTTPGCPMERIITDGIRRAALSVDGVTRVDTRLVWEPSWHSGMIAPEALFRND
jgi:metal-sulfur cluster biosynthetic enzyme